MTIFERAERLTIAKSLIGCVVWAMQDGMINAFDNGPLVEILEAPKGISPLLDSEPTAIVEFRTNGRLAIPLRLLMLPGEHEGFWVETFARFAAHNFAEHTALRFELSEKRALTDAERSSRRDAAFCNLDSERHEKKVHPALVELAEEADPYALAALEDLADFGNEQAIREFNRLHPRQ